MNIEIFFIVICYVLIGFLLIVFNLRTNFHWLIKATMIVIVTLFYVLTYKSFKNLLGWPSSELLPDRFRLVAAQIYEPNALTYAKLLRERYQNYLNRSIRPP